MKTATEKKVRKTEEEWKQELTPQEFHILRQKGTERPFTGKYLDNKQEGVYRCAACGAELFGSETKYESGSGWPSFWTPLDEDNVRTAPDNSLAMSRTEVLCDVCDSHLGHVFEDGPQPTGLRYCINSTALDFEKQEGNN